MKNNVRSILYRRFDHSIVYVVNERRRIRIYINSCVEIYKQSKKSINKQTHKDC
jgi:hypothetical protein